MGTPFQVRGVQHDTSLYVNRSLYCYFSKVRYKYTATSVRFTANGPSTDDVTATHGWGCDGERFKAVSHFTLAVFLSFFLSSLVFSRSLDSERLSVVALFFSCTRSGGSPLEQGHFVVDCVAHVHV